LIDLSTVDGFKINYSPWVNIQCEGWVKIQCDSTVVLTQSPRQQMVAVKGNLQPEERVVLMPMGLTAGRKVRPKLAKPNGEMDE
jgi:hypothetical protein